MTSQVDIDCNVMGCEINITTFLITYATTSVLHTCNTKNYFKNKISVLVEVIFFIGETY